jgi:CBS domain-containing protein
MFVRASATMASARELMQRNGLSAIGVIDEVGNLVGFLRGPQSKSAQTS